MKNGISREDLERLVKAVRVIAELHVKYISKDFGPQEIARTFAAIYYREFATQLTPQAIGKLTKEFSSHPTELLSRHQAAGDVCISMSGSFIEIVTKILKEEDEKEAQKRDREELAQAEAECQKLGL